MKNVPSDKKLKKMPKRFSITDARHQIIAMGDMPIGMHFFSDDYDWYMIEYDRRRRYFYGFTLNKQRRDESTFERIGLDDLINYHSMKGSEVIWDENWTHKKVSDVEEIGKALGVRYRSETIISSDDNRTRSPFYKKLFHLDFK